MIKLHRILAGLVCLAFAASIVGCAGAAPAPAAAEEAPAEAAAEEAAPTEEAAAAQEAPAEEAPAEEAAAPEEAAAAEETAAVEEAAALRIGSLKGPTTLGLLSLMEKAAAGEAEGSYEFRMATQADELSAAIVSGDIDIALIPANLASVLYNKTEGGIRVLDINTLGVLCCVTGDETVKSIEDFAGREVITTGQGTTPEFSLRYLLSAYGVEDCTLTFKSEATEVAAFLAEDPTAIAILPQPFATSALMQNDALAVAFSLTDMWDATDTQGRFLTGVTVVRTPMLEENPEAVWQFVHEQGASVEAVNADPAHAGVLAEEQGIIGKAKIAELAIPECNLVCITGGEMKEALTGYLQVLFDAEPKSVGGKLPADDFCAAE